MFYNTPNTLNVIGATLIVICALAIAVRKYFKDKEVDSTKKEEEEEVTSAQVDTDAVDKITELPVVGVAGVKNSKMKV